MKPIGIKNVYSIGNKLGTGGFAVVRKCKRRDTGEVFALKVINKKNLDKDDLVILDSEVKIMRQVLLLNYYYFLIFYIFVFSRVFYLIVLWLACMSKKKIIQKKNMRFCDKGCNKKHDITQHTIKKERQQYMPFCFCLFFAWKMCVASICILCCHFCFLVFAVAFLFFFFSLCICLAKTKKKGEKSSHGIKYKTKH